MHFELIIIAVTLIAFDIITGFLKATKTKTLNSQIMREGLFHKVGEIILIALSAFIEYYALDFVSINIDIPLVGGTCVYIIIMELMSILENIAILNPQLSKLISPYLDKIKDNKNTGVQNNGNKNRN